MGIVGWVGHPELYARLLLFDQPFGGVLEATTHKQVVERLSAHTAWAFHQISEAIGMDHPGIREPSWQDQEPPSWVPAIRKLLSVKSEEIWVTRASPNWRYYTASKNAFSVTELEQGAARRLRLAFGWYDPVVVERENQHVLRAANLFNSVPSNILRRGVKIIQAAEQGSAPPWRGLAAKPEENAIMAIPLESHCVFLAIKQSSCCVARADMTIPFSPGRLGSGERGRSSSIQLQHRMCLGEASQPRKI